MDRSRRWYLCHHSRHVTLDIADPAILDDVRAFGGPMVSASAVGTCVEAIAVDVDDDRVVVISGPARARRSVSGRRLAARDILHVAIRAFIDARPDWLWLHAGVVADRLGAWILVAYPGAGKSTLVAEIVARGGRYFTDEVAALDPATMSAIPFPLTPYRRHATTTAPLAHEDVRKLRKVEVDVPASAIATREAPVRGVCFLSYAAGEPDARIDRARPAVAVAKLMRHSFGGRHTRAFELEGFARLVERVPVARLAFRCAATAADRLEEIGLDLARHPVRNARGATGDRASC